VHLAELSNDPLGELNERTTYEINHVGSVALAAGLQECRGPALRLYVFVQRLWVRPRTAAERSELSAPNPQTAYARCKSLTSLLHAAVP
jgi:hypothetical protein